MTRSFSLSSTRRFGGAIAMVLVLASGAAPTFEMLPELIDRARPGQPQHRVRLDKICQTLLGPIDVVIVERNPLRGTPAPNVTQNLGASREREPAVPRHVFVECPADEPFPQLRGQALRSFRVASVLHPGCRQNDFDVGVRRKDAHEQLRVFEQCVTVRLPGQVDASARVEVDGLGMEHPVKIEVENAVPGDSMAH